MYLMLRGKEMGKRAAGMEVGQDQKMFWEGAHHHSGGAGLKFGGNDALSPASNPASLAALAPAPMPVPLAQRWLCLPPPPPPNPVTADPWSCHATACSFLPQFLPFLPFPLAVECPLNSPCSLLTRSALVLATQLQGRHLQNPAFTVVGQIG